MSAFCEVVNGRGEKLKGVVSGDDPRRLVLSCHGLLSNKDGNKHQRLAALLEQRGVSCLRFDFAGCGASEGRLFDTTYSSRLEDLQAMIEYGVQLGAQKLGLFGSSVGGTVALLAAARDERIRAVATLAATGNTAAIAERYPSEANAWDQLGYIETKNGRIGRDLFDDALQHDVLAATRVLRAPILVMHGENDEVVPVLDAHDIAAAARRASLEIVLGADHYFSRLVDLRPMLVRVVEFLSREVA